LDGEEKAGVPIEAWAEMAGRRRRERTGREVF
jgi:hypothetical protein